jgi:hypothetical protein
LVKNPVRNMSQVEQDRIKRKREAEKGGKTRGKSGKKVVT